MKGEIEMNRRILGLITGVLAAVSLCCGTAFADKLLLINGAGATFPYPLYSKWFYEYTKVDPSVNFNYQAIGSGGGIRQITAQTVDFGASDGALTDVQLKQAPGELLHIPMTAGAVVITYNLPQISQVLKFSPDVVAGIYQGKISKWNDPRIASDNPGVNLPNQNIIVAHRSDGSGTTNIFTDYLSSVSKGWKAAVGKGTSVNWPVGLGGKGNEGVAGLVKQTQGAIGYVELAYAVKNNLPCADIKNKSGNFITPSIESTTAAVNGKVNSMPADFRVSLVNPDGANAYPIAGVTWILVYKNQTDKIKGQKIVEFLRWGISEGQKYSADLLYAPLPQRLVNKIEEKINEISY
jgi:phosphate transport system substrate-binding protein